MNVVLISQVFHRWSSYAMFVLALIHTFPFIVKNIERGEMVMSWNTSVVYWTGVAALVPQAWLTFMSIGPIRNRFYEFFKATHFLAALLFVLFFFFHCDHTLTSWDYFIATGSIYLACLLFSQVRTFLAYGVSRHATLSVNSAGLVEVNIPIHADYSAKQAIPTGFKWSPGQHIFIRFLGHGLHSMSTHPFTICSLPPSSPKEIPNLRMLIKPSGGFTERLLRTASREPNGQVPVWLDGPYGGFNQRTWTAADKILLIAGGSGAGFLLPVLESLVRDCCAGSGSEKGGFAKCPQIQMTVAMRRVDQASWYEQEIEDILDRYGAKDLPLAVSVYVTDEDPATSSGSVASGEEDEVKKAKEATAKSALVTTLKGRPDLPLLVTEASQEEGIALGVAVCGPSGMLYDVRNATAQAQRRVLSGGGARSVYLHSEHFS
jgi:NAD(P)H-flavin reductase